MLKQLSNRQKSIVLLAGMFFSLLLSYNVAFKKTFTLKAQCREMKQKLIYLDKAPGRINQIKSKIGHIDRLVGKNQQYLDTEELLLEEVGSLCKKNNVVFKEFPGNHSVSNKDYIMVTYKMILQGRFVPLLKVLHELEKDFGYGKIASVEFYTEKEIRNGTRRLNMKLIVQSIKLKENEKNNS